MTAMRVFLGCMLLASNLSVGAAKGQAEVAANPIRRVVSMMQSMQKKISAEGDAEQKLFDKFNCYCQNGDAALAKSISEADTKVPQVAADIEEGQAQVAQLKADLKSHQTDRAAAKAAMAEATSLREKEASEFAATKSELDANLASLAKATTAIENGMAGSFLQTNDAQVLKKLVLAEGSLADFDREEITSFLSGSQSYAPSSGQITGILKEMSDTMTKTLGDATAAESTAIQNFDGLMAAKTKEVNALTKSIEEKSVRLGELQVSIVEMKEDLDDTGKALLEDKKFLADLGKNCALKTKEHDENMKMRSEELLALSDTIKLLNDDDALELFKKTLPGASASFVQILDQRRQALAIVRAATQGRGHPELNFLALALQGKKVNFSKVIKMIDNMVATLKVEQQDDADKKEYCEMQFDAADDKKKGLERSVSNLEKAIAKVKEAVATLTEEISTLEAGIVDLDKSVAEATEQRKEENAEYKELMHSNGAAKELLGFAKNRLNKFYNPKLAVLAEVSAHKAAPGPPPATAAAFSKKSEEGNGVIGMIDTLVKDITKEMTVAETTEKDAQADYEQAMTDSTDKRATDSKTLADKQRAKAEGNSDLEAHTEEKAATTKTLMATLEYIQSLHAECDWLLQYFEVRKEARMGEIDSLKNAKSVLSGMSFVETASRSLRGHA